MSTESITYVGEHLIYGQLGHLAILTGFVFAILASLAYFKATSARGKSPGQYIAWRQLGRISFVVHSISVFAIIGILFYLLINKHYEYAYVYDHTSDELPFRYIFSAFWEGQEGSFLLWAFWHAVLGGIFIVTNKNWESSVIPVITVVQAFIFLMLLGIHLPIGEEPLKIGINPFVLLRDTIDAPIFQNADYLSQIQGRGLNALLQNYWMTIHPPTLFLGFASATIPFGFAIAGLWRREYTSWLTPSFPWVAFSAGILGLGILMGGAWAYEALTFGGYWAWDPVENMSLVPWLVMIAGFHTHFIAKRTGHSLKGTFLLYILAFTLVVYSTFLVRSGILEETSVHAFVESGLEKLLFFFLIFFPALGLVLFIKRYRDLPIPAKEEGFFSREFWMFVGVLVLVISSILITVSTSLPVINAIIQYFNPTFEPMVINDPIEHYNKHQIWIAILIGLLSGFAQWTRYGEKNFARYRKKLGLHLGISFLLAVLLSWLSLYWLQATAWQYQLLLFSGFFAVLTNSDYFIQTFRQQPKGISSWISHAGFGLMILGILANGLNKEVLSSNLFAQKGLLGMDEETLEKNIVLLRGSPMPMRGYEVTYLNDSIDGTYRTYDLQFVEMDVPEPDTFILQPDIVYNNDFSNVEAFNPDTRRYWNYDVFAHLSGLPPNEIDLQKGRQMEDSLDYRPYELSVGDTIDVNGNLLTARPLPEGIPDHPEYDHEQGDAIFGLELESWNQDLVETETSSSFLVVRRFQNRPMVFQYAAYFPGTRLKVRLPYDFYETIAEERDTSDAQILPIPMNDTLEWKGFDVFISSVNNISKKMEESEDEPQIEVEFEVNLRGDPSYVLRPHLIIRGDSLQTRRDTHSNGNVSAEVLSVDPEKELVITRLSKKKDVLEDLHPKRIPYPLEVAENVPRSDYIVISATKFPGINLFWLGSCMLLIGFFVSAYIRRKGLQ